MQMVDERFASSVSLLVNGQLRMTGAADDVMNSEEVRSVYLGNTGQERLTWMLLVFEICNIYGGWGDTTIVEGRLAIGGVW